MVYQITYEDKGNGTKAKVARPVRTRARLMALRNSKTNLRNLAKAREGDSAAKAKLVQLAYNIGYADGPLAGCKSQGSFFFHDVDCYDAAQSEATKELILTKKDEIGLVMMERSASGGWHLVCKRVPGTTILENQVRVATILQLEMDTSAKDLQRVVFTTSGEPEDLVYLDDIIFTEPMTPEECEAEFQRLRERQRSGREEVPQGAKKANKHYRPWEGKTLPQRTLPQRTLPQRTLPQPLPVREGSGYLEGHAQGKTLPQPLPVREGSGYLEGHAQGSEDGNVLGNEGGKGDGELRFKGMRYKDIIAEFWRRTGGEPVEGERNVRLYQLAVNLKAICDNSAEKLLEVMPRLGLSEEEMQQIVASACKETPKGLSKLLREVIQSLAPDSSSTGEGGQGAEDTGGSEGLSSQGDAEGNLPPAMPAKLPQLIGLLTSKTPEEYKAAVAHAVFPALATHLCEVRFNYTDNVEHEATLMNCLMAVTGAGKGCIDEPIQHIMEDIKLRDEENTRREAEWKIDCQRKGANKDKQLRPQGLVIQIIDPDMTKPALVTRMDEAEGHFVYVKLNELDLFDQLKGTTGKQHFQLMCLAFDPGATYGQTRVGTQSVTARPRCRFNWNACTTILKGRRFFHNVLTDGPISRINFCTIPETEIGCEQPVYGKYDEEFDEALKPYIDNLTAARGLIDCPQAFDLARRLQQECAEFARLSQSETYWNLSHRACVIAWLKACVLYVAGGQQWEPEIEDFVRWSLEYDLWCKMEFFGADIEKANEDTERTGKRGPRNLLELLPDKFTLDDAKRVRKQQGISNDGHKAIRMIRTWVNRGYVIQNTEYSFQKST